MKLWWLFWGSLIALGIILVICAGITALVLYGTTEDWLKAIGISGAFILVIALFGASYPR